MGCSASRLHDNPAVSLCRDRCIFLDDALHHSYALADAHLAYMHSLDALGPTLHRFFDQISISKSSPPPAVSPDRSLSSSSSDSHIRFKSDSEDEDRDKECGSFEQIRYNYQSLCNQNFEYSDFSNGLYPARPIYGVPSFPQSSGGGSLSPPPPPAPNSSAWDFLNLFETFEKFEMAPHITNSEFKEANDKDVPVGAVEKNQGKEKIFGRNGKKTEAENVLVKNELSTKNTKNSVVFGTEISSSGVSEVLRKVLVQFEKAAKSGSEVLKLLDVGRFRYHHKNSVYQVSSKVLHFVSEVPSESIKSKLPNEKIGSAFGGLDDEGEMGVNSGNLSDTLKKLCMWERKLYDEVKAEEKLRMIQEKKSRQLKLLDEKGAEAAHKVDAVRTLVRTICTKRKIAFQVVDKLAITISYQECGKVCLNVIGVSTGQFQKRTF